MENVNPQLEVIAVELQVPETVAQTISSNLQMFFDKHQEWKGMIESLKIDSIEDVGNMAVARQIRLDLKRKRIEAEKLVDSNRDKVKLKMSDYVLEDKLWLKSGQIIVALFQDLEDKAKKIEDFAENELKKKKIQLEQERRKLLEPYSEIINADRYDLQNMPDNEFGILLTGIQHSFDELLKKRKEEAEKEQRTQKRKDDLLLAGLKFNGQSYYVSTQKELIPILDADKMPHITDDEFNQELCRANQLIEVENQRLIEVQKELQKKKEQDEVRNFRVAKLHPATYVGIPPSGSVVWNERYILTDDQLINFTDNQLDKFLDEFKLEFEEHLKQKRAKQLDESRRKLIEPYLKYVPKPPDDYSQLTEKAFGEMLASVTELDSEQKKLDEKIKSRRGQLFSLGFGETEDRFLMHDVGSITKKLISEYSDHDFNSFINDAKETINDISQKKIEEEKKLSGSDKEKLNHFYESWMNYNIQIEPKTKKAKLIIEKFNIEFSKVLGDMKMQIDKL